MFKSELTSYPNPNLGGPSRFATPSCGRGVEPYRWSPSNGSHLAPSIPEDFLRATSKLRGFTSRDDDRQKAAVSLAGFRTAIAYSQAASPTLQAFRQRACPLEAPALGKILPGELIWQRRMPLYAKLALSSEKSVGLLLSCFGRAGFFTPLQKVLKQLLGLHVSSRLARR
jgi:hypothetical protein